MFVEFWRSFCLSFGGPLEVWSPAWFEYWRLLIEVWSRSLSIGVLVVLGMELGVSPALVAVGIISIPYYEHERDCRE